MSSHNPKANCRNLLSVREQGRHGVGRTLHLGRVEALGGDAGDASQVAELVERPVEALLERALYP